LPACPQRSTIPLGLPTNVVSVPSASSFPSLDLPPGRTPRQEMWELAVAGASQRYGELPPAIEARLRKEVDVIDTLGYLPAFSLSLTLYVAATRAHLAAWISSSSVAAAVGIHDIYPIALIL
jgi:hypothetical protein